MTEVSRLLLVAAALAAVVVIGFGAGTGRPVPPQARPVAAPLPAALLVRRAPADAFGAVQEGFGDVWANDPQTGSLLRLEGRTGGVKARIAVGGRVALP